MQTPKILFQDQSLLTIEKPPSWIVNQASTTTTQPVLQTWLEKKSYPLAKNKTLRSGIVHRLDKETSGILLVAKNKISFENLQAEFKARRVKKTYLALVHGQLKPKEGSVKLPVGRLPWNRQRFGVLPGGRPSDTHYQVKKIFQKGSSFYSLVELKPKTGRTHQIRIHMKHLGHPLVADTFYAGRKTAKKDRAWCPRLFLHASKISFAHPQSAKIISFSSPLPSDLAQALDKLESSSILP